MRMLVTIQVARLDACGASLFDLRAQLAFDVALPYQSRTDSGDELWQSLRKKAGFVHKRRDFFGSGHRPASDKDEVASDSKSWIRASTGDGVIKSIRIRHESRACKYSLAVRSDDTFVDARRHAEVVGVENQFFHRVGFAKQEEMVSRRDSTTLLLRERENREDERARGSRTRRGAALAIFSPDAARGEEDMNVV